MKGREHTLHIQAPRADLKRARALIAAFVCAALTACASAPTPAPTPAPRPQAPPTPAPEPPAPDPAPRATTPAPTPAAPEVTQAPPPAGYWIDWVASHCLVNELGYSDYGRKWMAWIHKERRAFKSFMPPDAPRLNFSPKPIPEPGTPEAKARAKALREDWMRNPRSQVVECTMTIARRDCPTCEPFWGPTHGNVEGQYVAYLPKALFTRPESVRSVLILVPGGKGGRTRYFLTPIPNKGVFDKRSGGLEVKRHSDEILAANPDMTPPLVIALDNVGWTMANGPKEYIAHDVPLHASETFLGGVPVDDLAVGVEGISAGSRMSVLTLWDKPDAFNTVGLTALHCGDAGADWGLNVEDDLAPLDQRSRWLERLAERRRSGDLELRFVVGNRDTQWPCVRAFHDMLVEGGVITAGAPRYERCRRRPLRHRPQLDWCDTHWDNFHLYDKRAHNYGVLIPSWRATMEWHLHTLSRIAQRKADRSADPKAAGGQP